MIIPIRINVQRVNDFALRINVINMSQSHEHHGIMDIDVQWGNDHPSDHGTDSAGQYHADYDTSDNQMTIENCWDDANPMERFAMVSYAMQELANCLAQERPELYAHVSGQWHETLYKTLYAMENEDELQFTVELAR